MICSILKYVILYLFALNYISKTVFVNHVILVKRMDTTLHLMLEIYHTYWTIIVSIMCATSLIIIKNTSNLNLHQLYQRFTTKCPNANNIKQNFTVCLVFIIHVCASLFYFLSFWSTKVQKIQNISDSSHLYCITLYLYCITLIAHTFNMDHFYW